MPKKENLEKLAERKERVEPVVREAMSKFLGVTVNEINEDISSKIIEGNIDYDVDVNISFKKAKEMFKMAFLINILQHTNGNISEAARIGAIDRRSIHRLIEQFKIDVNKLRTQPYHFDDTKKEMYVKGVVEETLGTYDITKAKSKDVNENVTKSIATKIPDIRLTFDEATDMFEKKYFSEAIKKWDNQKVCAKKIGLRYETLHKKLKDLELI